MATIDTEIKNIEKEIVFKTQLMNELKAMQAIYPNIRRVTGRWDKIAFCSDSVNNKVTNYETRFNCGCCSDSPLEVWFYLEVNIDGRMKKIYSDPPYFYIGSRNNYVFCKADPGWEKPLYNANISESIIQMVSNLITVDEKVEDNELSEM